MRSSEFHFVLNPLTAKGKRSTVQCEMSGSSAVLALPGLQDLLCREAVFCIDQRVKRWVRNKTLYLQMLGAGGVQA